MDEEQEDLAVDAANLRNDLYAIIIRRAAGGTPAHVIAAGIAMALQDIAAAGPDGSGIVAMVADAIENWDPRQGCASRL